MLTTLLPPTSGTAEVAGADIVKQPALVRSRIGYIGQGNGGGHSFRVLDELHSQGRFYGLSTAEATARAAELVASLDLTGLEKRTVGSLSGGQRRRLDVALGSDELPEAAVPGRALDRDGPAEPGQPVGAHPPAAGRARHHHRADHPLPGGGGRGGGAGGGHRPRRDHRRRHRRAPEEPPGGRPAHGRGGPRRPGAGALGAGPAGRRAGGDRRVRSGSRSVRGSTRAGSCCRSCCASWTPTVCWCGRPMSGCPRWTTCS